MSKKKDECRLFAFWRYDLFPYCLGGEVSWSDDGSLFLAEKRQSSFRRELVFAAYPVARGKEILAALEGLRAEHRKEIAAVNACFCERAREVLPELRWSRP